MLQIIHKATETTEGALFAPKAEEFAQREDICYQLQELHTHHPYGKDQP